jgi:hypothetical protein
MTRPKIRPITGAEADRMTWDAIPTWRDEPKPVQSKAQPVSRVWKPERKVFSR